MEPKTLNETFVPKQIIRKTTFNSQNNLANNSYQKTGGNIYIEIEPSQIKFEGYQLNNICTANIKVVNKAPIPQRIHIIAPTQSSFSIKAHKKGQISSGMSQNITVQFKSNEYKYQNDLLKINTQTQNFVVALHAYPTIPKIKQIFPKLIDFGSVQVNKSQSIVYPIMNPIPLNYGYEFFYSKESPAFMITPLKGTIEANSTESIQITFVPSEKITYTADVYLSVQQYNFQPILIKVMGSGKDKKIGLQTTKRVKSSKLNPIKQQQSKVLDPFEDSNTPVNNNKAQTQKKSFIRSKATFPKLFKKTMGNNTLGITQNQNQKPTQSNLQNIGQKQYLSRFSRVQQLDKQKEVKFAEYLGDRALTQEQIQFERKMEEQYRNTRIKNKILSCEERYEVQLRNDGEVEFQKFHKKEVTWDNNKNDELKQRKDRLQLFMKAGSKVIQKYRLQKRLLKIRAFLQGCNTKEDVAKKVEESYNKSLDMAKSNTKNLKFDCLFSRDTLAPASFPLQFKENNESIKKVFGTAGKPEFDDNAPIQQIQKHETQALNFNNLTYPSDFFHFDKFIPSQRKSGQQEYPLKTTTLPQYSPSPLSSIYTLPLKIPSHHFIYNDFTIKRYKNLQYVDEKDPEYLIDSTLNEVEDEFQGWSKGDMDVLKAKFQRNLGVQFTSISQFNSPNKEIAFLSELGSKMPKQIANNEVEKDDIIEDGDSDEEKDPIVALQKGSQFIDKLQQNSKKTQERREKQMQNYEEKLLQTVGDNLESIKLKQISTSTSKIRQLNKWAQSQGNRILI